jgi:hypothetical protein
MSVFNPADQPPLAVRHQLTPADATAAALVQTDPLTLSAWILTQQHKSAGARGRLTVLLNAIGVGCKFVSSAVRRVRAGLSGLWVASGWPQAPHTLLQPWVALSPDAPACRCRRAWRA